MKRELLISFRGNISQAEIAEKYNVTQQTWCNWERGFSTPNAMIMKKLEIDSGIPMENLFADVFNKTNLLDNQKSA